MSGIDIDCSAFDDFAGDLRAAATEVGAGIPGVVRKGALNVKTEWADAFRARTHFAKIAATVTYDVTERAGFVEAEIGPNKDTRVASGKSAGPAALANIAHFGGVNGGGGTVADPQTFLDNEAEGFTKALGDLIDKALS